MFTGDQTNPVSQNYFKHGLSQISIICSNLLNCANKLTLLEGNTNKSIKLSKMPNIDAGGQSTTSD